MAYTTSARIQRMQISHGFKKYFSNISWLFCGKISRYAVTLFVIANVTRYLGPSDYGLLNYATSFAGLFSTIVSLGLETIIIRDLVRHEKATNELLGTVFVLKIIGWILMIAILTIAMKFTKEDNLAISLIFIIAFSYVFDVFLVINYYFQSKVLSKYTVYVQTFAGISSAIIKYLFIYLRTSLIYFAVVLSIEKIIIVVGLIAMYTRQELSLFDWKMKYSLARRLLKDSWPLLFGGVAVCIHMRVDQIIIRQLLDDEAVGNYAIAARLSEVTLLVSTIIVSSVSPAITKAKGISEDLYYRRLQKLYDLMTWLSVGLIFLVMLFADEIVGVFSGGQYQTAAQILRIYIWSILITNIGISNSQYIINENYSKILLLRDIIGMVLNILLNFLLIPRYNTNGAAVATLISYSLSLIIILSTPKTFKNSILIIKSISGYNLISLISRIILVKRNDR